VASPYEEGNPSSPICIVGEAPSYSEMRLSKPLAGPAGQLFDKCLHEAGMVRAGLYITNLFEHEVRRVRDGEELIAPDGECLWKKGRGFTARGYEAVEKLRSRLERTRAKVIVPLGEPALNAVCKRYGITKWRGSPLATEIIPGRKAIPTIHPAATLRGQYLWRYHIQHDLAKAQRHVGIKQIGVKRNFVLNPSFTDACGFLDAARRKGRVATDIEVYNNQVSCFSVATSATDCISIPLLNENGNDRWNEDQEATIWQLYSRVLSDEKIEKINQNIVFDKQFLWMQNHILMQGYLGDTMIAQAIMYPDFPKGLDFICSIRTDEPYYKDDGKLWKNITKDPYRFWEYNAKDAAIAFEAWESLEKELDEEGYRDQYEYTMGLLDPIIYMETDGLLVDVEELKKVKLRVEGQIADVQARLKEVADYEFNPGSTTQGQKYFYIHKGIKPYVSRKTGNPTLDDDALVRIIKRYNFPEARLVQEYRKLTKLYGTYLDILLDPDNRLRCSYNPRGTSTGRLSSSTTIRGTGTNMQNLVPELKTFIVADGWVDNG
jgi:uracil-DNA glycosylase